MNSIVIESINYPSRLVQSLSSKFFLHLPLINHSYCFHPCPLWFSFHSSTCLIHPIIVHVFPFICLQFIHFIIIIFHLSSFPPSFTYFIHNFHSFIIFNHPTFIWVFIFIHLSSIVFVHERLSFIFIYHSSMGAHYSCAHQIGFPDGWCSSTGWVQEHCHPSH